MKNTRFPCQNLEYPRREHEIRGPIAIGAGRMRPNAKKTHTK